MALKFFSRVQETSTTTGTGTYTLAGASTGYRTFAGAGGADTDQFYGVVSESGTSGYEEGIYTLGGSGTTLARTAILISSNSNNAVNWSAGTRTIALTAPSRVFVGGWELIASATASASSTIDFTGFDSDKYERYQIDFWNFKMTSDHFPVIRTSTDGGSSYDSGASDYISLNEQLDGAGYPIQVITTDSVGYLESSLGILATTDFPAFGWIDIFSPQSAQYSQISFHMTAWNRIRSKQASTRGAIWRQANADVNGIRIMPLGATTIAVGDFRFYGRRR